MNATEVQNPRRKLDDKYLCLLYVFGFVLACAKLLTCFRSFALQTLSLTALPQTLRLFYISLHSQAPQKQHIVHCMHYGIAM